MPWEKAILRSGGGLQVNRVVDGMRPGVGRQEFVMATKALAQVGAESVINGAPVGKVSIHVAEGDAVGEGRRIAGSVEALGLETLQDLLAKTDTCCATACY